MSGSNQEKNLTQTLCQPKAIHQKKEPDISRAFTESAPLSNQQYVKEQEANHQYLAVQDQTKNRKLNAQSQPFQSGFGNEQKTIEIRQHYDSSNIFNQQIPIQQGSYSHQYHQDQQIAELQYMPNQRNYQTQSNNYLQSMYSGPSYQYNQGNNFTQQLLYQQQQYYENPTLQNQFQTQYSPSNFQYYQNLEFQTSQQLDQNSPYSYPQQQNILHPQQTVQNQFAQKQNQQTKKKLNKQAKEFENKETSQPSQPSFVSSTNNIFEDLKLDDKIEEENQMKKIEEQRRQEEEIRRKKEEEEAEERRKKKEQEEEEERKKIEYLKQFEKQMRSTKEIISYLKNFDQVEQQFETYFEIKYELVKDRQYAKDKKVNLKRHQYPSQFNNVNYNNNPNEESKQYNQSRTNFKKGSKNFQDQKNEEQIAKKDMNQVSETNIQRQVVDPSVVLHFYFIIVKRLKKEELRQHLKWLEKIQSKTTDDDKKYQELKFRLNQIAPDNLDFIKEQVTEILTKNPELIQKSATLIFEMSQQGSKYREIYTKLCQGLINEQRLNEKSSNSNKQISLFKNALLNFLQSSFEEQKSQYNPNIDAEDQYRKKQKMMGNIYFIAELILVKVIPAKALYDVIASLLMKFLTLNFDAQKTENSEDYLEQLIKFIDKCIYFRNGVILVGKNWNEVKIKKENEKLEIQCYNAFKNALIKKNAQLFNLDSYQFSIDHIFQMQQFVRYELFVALTIFSNLLILVRESKFILKI